MMENVKEVIFTTVETGTITTSTIGTSISSMKGIVVRRTCAVLRSEVGFVKVLPKSPLLPKEMLNGRIFSATHVPEI